LQASTSVVLVLALAFQACLHRTRDFVVAISFLDHVLRMRLHLLQAFAKTILVLVFAFQISLYKIRVFLVAILALALVL